MATDSLVRKVETRGGFIAQRLALDVHAALVASASKHKKSGQMEHAIKVTQVRVSPTRWRVLADVPVIQAATTDRGARPHVIEPRTKKALAFQGRNGMVVVKRVNHPGNKGSGWFREVMNAVAVRGILSRFVGR